jgi:TRAP-type mannitol/chloroaromatic compound transport system substrate-binding protein
MTQADLVAIKAFGEKGVSMEPVPKDIENELVKQATTLYADYCAKDPAYKKVYDSFMNFMNTYRANWVRM